MQTISYFVNLCPLFPLFFLFLTAYSVFGVYSIEKKYFLSDLPLYVNNWLQKRNIYSEKCLRFLQSMCLLDFM